MTHFRIRLAVRAFLAFVSPTVAHAAHYDQHGRLMIMCHTERCTDMIPVPDAWICIITVQGATDCRPPIKWTEQSCAPGYEAACQQRDHGASPYGGHGQ